MEITHKKVVTTAQNPAFEVSKDEWNDLHEIIGGGGTPSDTVVTEKVFGQSEAAGSSADYSRGDHTHGTPTLPQLELYTPFGTFGVEAVNNGGSEDFNAEFAFGPRTGGNDGGAYYRLLLHPFISCAENVDVETALIVEGISIEEGGFAQASFLLGNSTILSHTPETYTDTATYSGFWYVFDGTYVGRFLAVTRDATGAEITDCGSPGALGFDTLKIVKRQTHVDFYLNNVLVATHTTHLTWESTWNSYSRVGISKQGAGLDQSVQFYYWKLVKW